jgi:DNA-binding winged helix-turn-helix (wHTH) protein
VRYRFGKLELDAATYTLSRAGRALSLQPKVFDVLRYLIEHRDRVVSKDELLESVWRGEHVNESAVPWSISHARSALGQRRGSKQPIETVHGRGYRFAIDVEVLGNTNAAPPIKPALPTPVPVAPASGPPFVGREDAMRRLCARVEDALGGSGRLCLVSGEPGIGKTRCSEEVLAYASQQGFHALVGRSFEDSGEPVFWPFIQIVRDALRALPELREQGEPLLARLATLDPGPANGNGVDREEIAQRFWPLDEITRFLMRASQVAPLALLLDDLQWADAGTLNLLNFLAPELPTARMLVLATQRDELASGDQRRLARLARHAERIELTRLTVEDVGRYMAEVTHAQQVPEPLARAVHRATAGTPLFVQETVRALIAEHGESALQTLDEDAIVLPEVARDVLRAPLAALEPDARVLLACASVLGERFELSLLAALFGQPLFRVLELSEAATRRRLLVAETPQRYRFAHALIRKLLYDEMPTAERVVLHRKAAEALEAQQSLEPRHNEIAHHYYRSLPAGGYDRIVLAARRAAAAAEAVAGYEDALRSYEWALEAQALDPQASPRSRAELLFVCGRAQRNAGRDADARSTIGRMLELARQHGYGDLLVHGTRALRPTYMMARVPDSRVRDALEEALRIAKPGVSEQRIYALSQLSCVPPYADDMQRSKELSERALELARELGDREPLLAALCARLYSLSGPDDTQALCDAADELLELDRERPSANSLEAYSARRGAQLYRGESAAVDRTIEAIGRTAHDLRLPESIWYYERQRAQRHCLRGDFAAARVACDELQARSARMGLSYGARFVQAVRIQLTIDQQGFHGFAMQHPNVSLASDGPNLRQHVRARLMRAAAELGRLASAKAGFDVVVAQGLDSIPKEVAYLNTLVDIALTAIILKQRKHAEHLYALLSPYPEHNTPDQLSFDMGSVSRYLASLAIFLERHDLVEAHYETALAMNRRMNRGPMVARTAQEYAAWLIAQRPHARAQARALRAEAISVGEMLGMAWLVERARTLPG